MPLSPPKIDIIMEDYPTICLLAHMKEINNRIFREESRTVEVVFGVMNKLLKENLRVAKYKMPKEEPGRIEGIVAENWVCQEDFFLVDKLARRRRQQTKWRPPTITQYKLNFDGAAKGGHGAAGGVLRDRNGDVLLVYAGKVGNGSNYVAEAMALLWGLQLSKERHILELTIEGDSKLVIDLVKGEARPGWKIRNIILDIKQILEEMRMVHLQHIYREGNQVADAAAAMGFNVMAITCWENLEDINEDLRTLISKEKGGKIQDDAH